MELGQLRRPPRGQAHVSADTQVDSIVADGRLEVCDGAHRAFVMKNGEAESQGAGVGDFSLENGAPAQWSGTKTGLSLQDDHTNLSRIFSEHHTGSRCGHRLLALFELDRRRQRLPVAQHLDLDHVTDFAAAKGIREVVKVLDRFVAKLHQDISRFQSRLCRG